MDICTAIEQIAIVYALSFVFIYISHSLILRDYRMTKINFTFVLLEQIFFAACLSRGISMNCLQARPGKS